MRRELRDPKERAKERKERRELLAFLFLYMCMVQISKCRKQLWGEGKVMKVVRNFIWNLIFSSFSFFFFSFLDRVVVGGSESRLGSILVPPCEQILFVVFVSIRMCASPPAAQLLILCWAAEYCSSLGRAVGWAEPLVRPSASHLTYCSVNW